MQLFSKLFAQRRPLVYDVSQQKMAKGKTQISYLKSYSDTLLNSPFKSIHTYNTTHTLVVACLLASLLV